MANLIDLHTVKPFDFYTLNIDANDVLECARFARTHYLEDYVEPETVSRENLFHWSLWYENRENRYYKIILEAMKCDNLEGVKILIYAISFHEHSCADYTRILELAVEYGSLRIVIFAFQKRLQGNTYYDCPPHMIFSKLLTLSHKNPNQNVRDFIKNLEVCVIHDQLPDLYEDTIKYLKIYL